jgi:hypothetical protein
MNETMGLSARAPEIVIAETGRAPIHKWRLIPIWRRDGIAMGFRLWKAPMTGQACVVNDGHYAVEPPCQRRAGRAGDLRHQVSLLVGNW